MHRYFCKDCGLKRRASNRNVFRCRRCVNKIVQGEGNRPNRHIHKLHVKKSHIETPKKHKPRKAKTFNSVKSPV